MDQPRLWRARKQQLWTTLSLLNPSEEEEGIALDAYILQREACGKSSASNELSFNELRFTNRDLSNLGALANGPFGAVDMVRCRLNNQIYVRKTVEKRVVTRNPAQCRPKHERDILVASTRLQSPWTPHLLCTFHTPLSLCYVMEYAESGSLGDLLESVGQITERDLLWWLPQMIAAIDWCHSQGFCHRDIKPSNFVVTSTCHLHLIDFASSARLLPADEEGVQLIPKESCLVLCGTCDYISPEILAMQEEALIALDRQEEIFVQNGEGGYGRETDWWSLGTTAYELVFGVAPFFAKDIRGTYEKIMNFEDTLDFPINSEASVECVDFISGLLQGANNRLGRRDNRELLLHRFLKDIPWTIIHSRPAPPWLELSQFEYNMLANSIKEEEDLDESYSKGFAFSAFFNSSASSNASNSNQNINATNLTFVRAPSPQVAMGQQDAPENDHDHDFELPPHLVQWMGFTWGPSMDAFDDIAPATPLYQPAHSNPLATPLMASKQSNLPGYYQRRSEHEGPSSAPPFHTHNPPSSSLVTPVRPSTVPGTMNPPSTIRRTVGGTARKAGTTRVVSELEALKQLGECVRASARKKLSENAGRTPGASGGSSALKRRASWARMTLDFEKVNQPSPLTGLGIGIGQVGDSNGNRRKPLVGFRSPTGHDGGLRIFVKDKSLRKPTEDPQLSNPQPSQPSNMRRTLSRRSSVIAIGAGGAGAGAGAGSGSIETSRRNSRSFPEHPGDNDSDQEDNPNSVVRHDGHSRESTGVLLFGAVANEDETRGANDQTVTTDEGPPSPSPTPRPTSALSKRGSTPILTPITPTTGPVNTGAGSFRRTSSISQSHSRSMSQGQVPQPQVPQIKPQMPRVSSSSSLKPFPLNANANATATITTSSIFKPPVARTLSQGSQGIQGITTSSSVPASAFSAAPATTAPTLISASASSRAAKPATTLARQALLRGAEERERLDRPDRPSQLKYGTTQDVDVNVNVNAKTSSPNLDPDFEDTDTTPRPLRQAQSAPPVFMRPAPLLPNLNSNTHNSNSNSNSYPVHSRKDSYPLSSTRFNANPYDNARTDTNTNVDRNAVTNDNPNANGATSLEGSLLFGGDTPTPRANRVGNQYPGLIDGQRRPQLQLDDSPNQQRQRQDFQSLQSNQSNQQKREKEQKEQKQQKEQKEQKMREMDERLQKLRSDIQKIEGGLQRAKLELEI